MFCHSAVFLVNILHFNIIFLMYNKYWNLFSTLSISKQHSCQQKQKNTWKYFYDRSRPRHRYLDISSSRYNWGEQKIDMRKYNLLLFMSRIDSFMCCMIVKIAYSHGLLMTSEICSKKAIFKTKEILFAISGYSHIILLIQRRLFMDWTLLKETSIINILWGFPA